MSTANTGNSQQEFFCEEMMDDLPGAKDLTN